jgi:hypothetical protein
MLADPGLPARRTAAWAAGGAAVAGAWAVVGVDDPTLVGVDETVRLGKVIVVAVNGSVLILYADDGAKSGLLPPAALVKKASKIHGYVVTAPRPNSATAPGWRRRVQMAIRCCQTS